MANLGVSDLEQGLNSAVTNTSGDLPTNIQNALRDWITQHLIPVLLVVLVFVVLLFTFYGAFLYFTAYGDENRATQAKKTLTYAIVGLIISLSAFGISYYVQDILINQEAAQNPNIQVPSQNPTSH
jgi:ABC-type Fe3+ transport system permease subunit